LKTAVEATSRVFQCSSASVTCNQNTATFNSGPLITVNLQVNDGSTNAPSCLANDGTTGETNNLNLGSCSATGGTSPYIQFTESN